jgi:hypothetical protein
MWFPSHVPISGDSRSSATRRYGPSAVARWASVQRKSAMVRPPGNPLSKCGVAGGFVSVLAFFAFFAFIILCHERADNGPLLQSVMAGWVISVFVCCLASLFAILAGASQVARSRVPPR